MVSALALEEVDVGLKLEQAQKQIAILSLPFFVVVDLYCSHHHHHRHRSYQVAANSSFWMNAFRFGYLF